MSNPTTADAELMLHLYELRTEAVMRRARQFVVVEFWPQNVEALQGIISSFGTEQNAWMRQVISYWEMAAGFALRGAVHEGIFDDSAGELYFLFAKFKPFIEEVRKVNPVFLAKAEEYVNRSKENQERVERVSKTITKLTAARAAQK
jgi:hypothetical protein